MEIIPLVSPSHPFPCHNQSSHNPSGRQKVRNEDIRTITSLIIYFFHKGTKLGSTYIRRDVINFDHVRRTSKVTEVWKCENRNVKWSTQKSEVKKWPEKGKRKENTSSLYFAIALHNIRSWSLKIRKFSKFVFIQTQCRLVKDDLARLCASTVTCLKPPLTKITKTAYPP